jgi:putative membrane protein
VSTEPPDGSGEWRRLHPLSPLLRGGVVLIAVLGYVGSQLYGRVLESVGLGVLAPEGDLPGEDGSPGTDGLVEEATAHPLLALTALAIFLGAIALANWVAWRFSRFRVDAGQVELRQGVLFRQHRQVRLERVQAVEISRPITARLLGLARVVVQSAGGSDSTLTLSFLDLSRAEALREHLLELAGRSDEESLRPDTVDGAPPDAGTSASGSPALPARAEGRPVLEVPNGRLFVATILHGSTIALGLVLLVGATVAGVRSVGPLALAGVPAMIPVAIGVAFSRVKELLVHGNFRLADTGTGVRGQEGLTDLRTTTIPIHRIQAIELVQPLWWRRFGWWRLRVNVAGSGGAGEGDGDRGTTLLPVGTLEEAHLLLSLLAPRVPATAWGAAVLGDAAEPGWQPVSARARLLDPLSWRRNAWTDAHGAVLLRSGRWTRRAVGVPHARIQSLSVRQGWLESSLALATVHVVTAPGPVRPVLAHLDARAAEAFLDEVSERARHARRRAEPARPSLAPDPPGLVDWVRHPQGSPDTERS